MQLSKIKEKGHNSSKLQMCSGYWDNDGKEISDLDNDRELTWDLEVPKHNVFTDTFYFKWTSNGAELMVYGTHGCASKSTKRPRCIGLPINPGEGGTLHGVPGWQNADLIFPPLRKIQSSHFELILQITAVAQLRFPFVEENLLTKAIRFDLSFLLMVFIRIELVSCYHA